MNDFLILFLLVFACALVILLFLKVNLENRWKNKKSSQKRLKTQKTENGGIDFVRCPVCSTPLAQGENLVSRIFRPMTTSDQRMNVLGCPHCYPKTEIGVKRFCPVCKKEISLEQYLVARLFNRTENKKHVMIMGCSRCLEKRKQ